MLNIVPVSLQGARGRETARDGESELFGALADPTRRQVVQLLGMRPLRGRLVLPGGMERMEEEYRRLLEAAGFRLTRVVPTRTWVSVIEGV